jgi:hypothetical protein
MAHIQSRNAGANGWYASCPIPTIRGTWLCYEPYRGGGQSSPRSGLVGQNLRLVPYRSQARRTQEVLRGSRRRGTVPGGRSRCLVLTANPYRGSIPKSIKVVIGHRAAVSETAKPSHRVVLAAHHELQYYSRA